MNSSSAPPLPPLPTSWSLAHLPQLFEVEVKNLKYLAMIAANCFVTC